MDRTTICELDEWQRAGRSFMLLDVRRERVRGADTARFDLAPQCAGLYAIPLGLSHVFADDHALLAHGLVMYDALYAWCRQGQGETHTRPPKM
jgi:hypothetical protein